MLLPTEKSKPTKKWLDQKILVLGPGKIGKSELFSQGDKTLFIETEPGLGHLSVMKVPVRSWEDFREVCGELYKADAAGKFPYDTLVIDTLDKLLDRACEEVIGLGKKKFSKIADSINTIGDIPNGAGWAWVNTLMSNALDKITEFPCAIVLITHLSTRRINDGNREYDKETVSLFKGMAESVIHWADHTLHFKAYMKGDRIRRVIRTKPTESMEAGSRGMIVPDGFELNGSSAESYSKLRSLFE